MMNFAIPVSIIAGFSMLAGAIYFKDAPLPDYVPAQGAAVVEEVDGDVSATRATSRLLYGEEAAEITIVEFSDFECPFCSRVHPTIKKIVDESGGSINWEYRHLPLPSHKTAAAAAFIGECVNTLGSNEKFWQYADIIFTSQEQRSVDYYIKVGASLGLDPALLESCANDDATRSIVEKDLADARSLGGSGTPYSVIVFPDGSRKPVSGALPYEHWASLLNL